MTYLSKDAILKAEDLDTEDVEVPEWGGSVRVRGMTAAERDKFEQIMSGENVANIRANLVARTVVDENGERLFTDADIGELGKKSAQALDRVFDASSRLSGLRSQDIDELEKN
jgi:hypothetical protein